MSVNFWENLLLYLTFSFLLILLFYFILICFLVWVLFLPQRPIGFVLRYTKTILCWPSDLRGNILFLMEKGVSSANSEEGDRGYELAKHLRSCHLKMAAEKGACSS